MVDRDVWDRRLAKLEELLRNLRRLSNIEDELYLSDSATQAQAERWLHLSIECALDLSNHLIADRGWQTPTSNKETFSILQEQHVIGAQLANDMKLAASLRNVLVHTYLDLDHHIILDVLRQKLDRFEQLAAALLAHAENE